MSAMTGTSFFSSAGRADEQGTWRETWRQEPSCILSRLPSLALPVSPIAAAEPPNNIKHADVSFCFQNLPVLYLCMSITVSISLPRFHYYVFQTPGLPRKITPSVGFVVSAGCDLAWSLQPTCKFSLPTPRRVCNGRGLAKGVLSWLVRTTARAANKRQPFSDSSAAV